MFLVFVLSFNFLSPPKLEQKAHAVAVVDDVVLLAIAGCIVVAGVGYIGYKTLTGTEYDLAYAKAKGMAKSVYDSMSAQTKLYHAIASKASSEMINSIKSTMSAEQITAVEGYAVHAALNELMDTRVDATFIRESNQLFAEAGAQLFSEPIQNVSRVVDVESVSYLSIGRKNYLILPFNTEFFTFGYNSKTVVRNMPTTYGFATEVDFGDGYTIRMSMLPVSSSSDMINKVRCADISVIKYTNADRSDYLLYSRHQTTSTLQTTMSLEQANIFAEFDIDMSRFVGQDWLTLVSPNTLDVPTYLNPPGVRDVVIPQSIPYNPAAAKDAVLTGSLAPGISVPVEFDDAGSVITSPAADVQNPPIDTGLAWLDSILGILQQILSALIDSILGAINGIIAFLQGLLTSLLNAILSAINSLASVISERLPAPQNEMDLKNYGLPDLFMLLIMVLLAILQLFISAVVFITMLQNVQPDTTILPPLVVQSIEFLHDTTLAGFNMSLLEIFNFFLGIMILISIIKTMRSNLGFAVRDTTRSLNKKFRTSTTKGGK